MSIVKEGMPPSLLEATYEKINGQQLDHLAISLKELLKNLQSLNHQKTFGICKTCRYFQESEGQQFICGLTQEPLIQKEIEQICREHEIIGRVSREKPFH